MSTPFAPLLGAAAPRVPGPDLQGDGIVLRPPRGSDHPAWAALRRDSHDWLQPWEPLWAEDELSLGRWLWRLQAWRREQKAGLGQPFLVFRAGDRQLLGGINISNIRGGVARDCTIGYWTGRPFAGRGHAAAAVRAIVGHAFGDLGLHRVQAAIIPDNAASRAVLLKTGFVEEGLARAYLRINGQWRDHALFGQVNPEPD